MTDVSSIVSTTNALGAYRAGAAAQGPDDFGEVLRAAASDAVRGARASEDVAAAGLRGEIDTQRVVEATLELETTLRVAVAMRDRFVQAYQDVLRMPI